VPVLAYRAGAVPHTLGDAGVQFGEKALADVAEMAHRLATDAALRAAVLAGQRRRVRDFAPAAVRATLKRYVESL
jgi:glycosyltransferase involved in cell wall biosynthesis